MLLILQHLLQVDVHHSFCYNAMYEWHHMHAYNYWHLPVLNITILCNPTRLYMALHAIMHVSTYECAKIGNQEAACIAQYKSQRSLCRHPRLSFLHFLQDVGLVVGILDPGPHAGFEHCGRPLQVQSKVDAAPLQG